MISMVLSGYVAWIFVAVIVTFRILCGLFLKNDYVVGAKGNDWNGGNICEIDKMVTF